MPHSTIEAARYQLLERGRPADRQLLSAIAALPENDVPDLLKLADDVRERYCGNTIAVEVLFNAKRGGCSEDCHFCSQSARFATDVE
ncbi:MAG: biotin synthase BioB, partial [Candidatus Eremiobacteraeota bacterium]|nr:biotin synthase BioB [Candidatus Eremiobacteraeota bacterium]